MGWSERDVREALQAAGLDAYADPIVSRAEPSIQLQPLGDRAGVRKSSYREPYEVEGVGEVVALACQGWHVLALRADGTVMAWGENNKGQLGDGTRVRRPSPVLVRDLDDVVAVAAGSDHSLALRRDGSVMGWGSNDGYALGDGSRTDRRRPVKAQEVPPAAMVAAGRDESLAVTAERVLWNFGLSVQIGRFVPREGPADIRPTPIHPALAGTIAAVVMGRSHTLALLVDRTVAAWGFNFHGALGDGTSSDEGPRQEPAPVPGLTGVTAAAAGEGHSLALREDGSVVAWGEGSFGQIGDGAGTDRWAPVSVAGLDRGVVAVAAWGHCSFALLDDGSVCSWGWNYEGRLGPGEEDRPVPTPIDGLGGPVVAIAPCVALRADGTVVAWGGEDPVRVWGVDATLSVGVSKLGGRPDLPKGMKWPRSGGRPLVFVAQLDLADLGEHPNAQGQLPHSGMLSFFCGDTDDHQPGRVLFTQPGANLRRVEFPAALDADQRFEPSPLRPTAHLSVIPELSDQLESLRLPDDQRIAYGDAIESLTTKDAPLHRMLGHPDAVQPGLPDRPDHVLLLQIDSDPAAGMVWGDEGRLFYWIDRDDLAAQRFDGCRFSFQSF